MSISKNRYYIGIFIFVAFAMFSLFRAWVENKSDTVTMMIAVIGFFTFMVIDRIQQAMAIEKLEDIILTFPL